MNLDTGTISKRLKVALILGEPLYLTASEVRELRLHAAEARDGISGVMDPGVAERPLATPERFMGVEVEVDLDKAMLQGNQYGRTDNELARLAAEQMMVNRLLDGLGWP